MPSYTAKAGAVCELVVAGVVLKVQRPLLLVANSIVLLAVVQAAYKVEPLAAKAGADVVSAQVLPLQIAGCEDDHPEPVLVV
jgi:hypothetical protein